MLKHRFKCPRCGKEMEYGMYQLRANVKCPHCQNEYIVSKSFAIHMLETMILIAVGYILLYGIFALYPLGSYVLELLLTAVALYLSNLLFDYIFDRVFHYQKLYLLIDKTNSSANGKKQQK